MIRRLALAAALAALPSIALAQTSPALYQGFVPTPAQWNSYFAAKQDVIGYVPVNKGGDTMVGRLVTQVVSAGGAGFNLPPGTPPSSPQDGDIYTTVSGLFVRIAGANVGPLGTGISSIANNTVLGNVSGISALPVGLTATQATTLCNAFTTSLKGCVPAPGSSTGAFLKDDGTWAAAGGTGTVTSVGLSLPAMFSVSGSPVTTSGTLTAALATQNANRIFSGPVTGSAAAPAFRALVIADIPNSILTAGTGLTGGALNPGTTFAADIATTSNIWNGTASKLVSSDGVSSALAFTTLVDIATVSVDMSLGINFTLTLGGNRTLGNPSNTVPGRCGVIYVVQPASGGPFTLTPGANWTQSGGFSGGNFLLSTAASAVDRISYCVRTSTAIDTSTLSGFAH